MEARFVVAGAATAPAISTCRIHDVAQRGISITDQATPQIARGEIRGCGLDGIEVSGQGCNPHIVGVHIHDVGETGTAIDSGAGGSTTDCDISKCGSGDGAIAVRGSAPIIRACRLHEAPRCGMRIFVNAAPRIEGGKIYGCDAGIIVVGGKMTAGT